MAISKAKAIIIFFPFICFLPSTISLVCNKNEKRALLSFKNALSDPGNRLSSWSADNEVCCAWNGVYCHNITGRVVQLHLRNPCFQDFEISCQEFILGGKVSPALLQLEFLNYLDLSWNDFGSIPIPSFLGSMLNLTHLDLSGESSFRGLIPSQLGNLSNLRYLSIGDDTFGHGGPQLFVENLSWISHLSSLESLYMNWVDLHKEVQWLEFMSMLSSLSTLQLNFCELDSMGPSLGYVNFTSLTILSLGGNHFNHEIPNWLFNLSHSLLQLDLSGNSLKGHIPNAILELYRLNALSLSWNQLTGQVPEFLGQLKYLEHLSLTYNYFDGPIPSSLGNLSSLTFLFLSENGLNGTLPSSLWLLPNLEDLEIGDNPLLVGTVLEAHLKKLSKLKRLDLSSTSLTFKVDNSNWVPPFQLELLAMTSCQMGPNFPTWLQTQTSLRYLYISKSGIVDIAPNWFWKWASHTDLEVMDLSDNQISGNLSEVWLNNGFIHLASNCFVGELPLLSPQVIELNMANNSLSGQISTFLCQEFNGTRNLQTLDISTNSISGELSHCLAYWQSISHLNLGNNNLSGNIPDSFASLFELEALHLSNNSFYGDILPSSLRNCSSFRLLDLRGNNYSGNIPSWIGEMTTLMVLSLRSNRLVGNIPPQICQLSSLIILDLANNSLSGTIPNCFNNFSSMAIINSLDQDDASDVFTYYAWGENFEDMMLVIKGENQCSKAF